MASVRKCSCGFCDSLVDGWQCESDQASGAQKHAHEFGRRDGATFIAVPKSMVGSLIGKGGETIKHLQEETGTKMNVKDIQCTNDVAKDMSVVEIRSMSPNAHECEAALELAARVVRRLCQDGLKFPSQLKNAFIIAREDMQAEEQERDVIKRKLYEDGMVRQVGVAVGDLFDEALVRDALMKEDWNADLAQTRLFQQRCGADGAKRQAMKPAIDAKKLLEACRAGNASRKAEASRNCQRDAYYSDEDVSSSASTDAPVEEDAKPISRKKTKAPVKAVARTISDVFAGIIR